MTARRIIVAVVATLAVTALIVGQNILSLRRLEGNLDQQSAAVAQAYARLSQTAVTALLQTADLSRGQREALEAIKERSRLAQASKTLAERVARTVALRESFVAAIALLPESTRVGQAQPSRSLRRAMGEASDLRPLLDAYNESAHAWNDRIASGMGGLTAALVVADVRPYPLLRFDGEQEYKTIIEL